MVDSSSKNTSKSQDIPEFEITPQMIEAGVYEAREHCLGEGLAELVRKVYLMMELARLDAKNNGFVNQPTLPRQSI